VNASPAFARNWPGETLAPSPSQESAYVQAIGHDLDRLIFPQVLNGGIVAPSDRAVPSSLGAENCDDSPKRSATRPRQGTTGREGTASPTRTAGEATSIQCASLQARYEAQLDDVRAAYPGACVWREETGTWLLTRSRVIPNFRDAAAFLVAISYTRSLVRAWGFWVRGAVGIEWIGPRHTNFPDGSICAFAPTDGTWTFGDSLLELLDLYTVWAFRHLHLALFGRWPGPQVAFHPYERLLEFRADEDCGCGSGLKYGHCCLEKDRSRPRLADAVNFTLHFAGGVRCPPVDVVQAVLHGCQPPALRTLPGLM